MWIAYKHIRTIKSSRLARACRFGGRLVTENLVGQAPGVSITRTSLDEAVSVGARHLIIGLRHHVADPFGRTEKRVHAHAKTAARQHRDRHPTTLEQFFNLAQVDRSVSARPLLMASRTLPRINILS
jgi:hypothetical protein